MGGVGGGSGGSGLMRGERVVSGTALTRVGRGCPGMSGGNITFSLKLACVAVRASCLNSAGVHGLVGGCNTRVMTIVYFFEARVYRPCN